MATVKKRYGTSRQRGSQDLKTAEEVQEKLEGVWLYLQKYRFPIVGGIVVLFVIVGILSAFESMAESEALEVNAVFTKAVAPLNAPVLPAEQAAQFDGPSFATEKERLDAGLASLTDFRASESNTPLGTMAAFVTAPVQFGLGNWDEAQKELEAVKGTAGSESLSTVLSLQLAQTASAKGDQAAATQHFTALTESTTPWFQLQGVIGLGDLSNPGFGAEGADAKAARTQYEKGLAIVDTMAPGTWTDALKAQVTSRLQAL